VSSTTKRFRNIRKISPAVYEYCTIDGNFNLSNTILLMLETLPKNKFHNYEYYIQGKNVVGNILWIYYTELLRENVTLVEFKLL